MKTKWAVLAGFAAIALAVAIGCDTKGGSSGTDGGGSTTKPKILKISFGLPTCSTSGQGSVNGAVFHAGVAYLYVPPACTDSNASMYVWIKVESSASASAIDHYDWTIKNWGTGAGPDGVFTPDTYDSVIDTNGVFKVRTTANQIRYMSAKTSDLAALTALYNQMIDVTAVTKDGQMASGYISLKLYNGLPVGNSAVFGSLTSADSDSQVRPGSFADYYQLTGNGATTVLDLEGDFDTYLALYDSNLVTVASNDDVIPGFNLNSQITSVLSNNATYFVEATSLSNNTAGNYSILASTNTLVPVPSPFASSGGSCSTIAGDYAVAVSMTIKFTFNGQTYATNLLTTANVTIDQSGCDFSYPLTDPSGIIPPTLLMGHVNFTTLTLFNVANMPQSPDIFITSSASSGSGRAYATGLQIDSAGSISGTYIDTFTPIAFQIDYTASASFQ